MSRQLDVVVDGIGVGESPRWHDGRIWYCDWVDGDVISVNADGTDRTVHAHCEGLPISIDWSIDGDLLIVDGAPHELRAERNGTVQSRIDLSPVSDRPWNDIVTHSSGRIYVNGIGYDMMAGEAATTGQVAVVDADGALRRVAGGLAFPNGMAINGDGTVLVVAESHAGRLSAFTIGDDGSLTDRRVFAEIAGSAPDGICFAPDDTLWYADVPNRLCRRVADGGAIIDTVDVDRGCFSCAVAPGGDLYITAAVWDDETFSTRRGVLYCAEVSR